MTGYETKISDAAETATTYAPRGAWDWWRAFTLDTAHHDHHAYAPGCAVYVRRNIVFHATPDQSRVYRCDSRAKAREVFAGIVSINPAR